MQIISHRGSKGQATENSLKSILYASKQNVAFIEFDIQYTKDNYVVLYQDTKTPSGKVIGQITAKSLLQEAPHVISINQALRSCQNTPALIESKTKGTIARCINVLNKYPNSAIASFEQDEILSARINAPNHSTFLLQHYHPFGIIGKAKKIDASGIGLNKNWAILFVYYYVIARKNNLKVYTYTTNSVWLAKLLNAFFSEMLICTDYPDRLNNIERK